MPTYSRTGTRLPPSPRIDDLDQNAAHTPHPSETPVLQKNFAETDLNVRPHTRNTENDPVVENEFTDPAARALTIGCFSSAAGR